MFEDFKIQLKKSITSHYQALKSEFEGEKFYGYSLYTSDDATSISPVANTLSEIEGKKSDSNYIYYKYGVDEWSNWEDFKMFEEVNAIITKYYDDMEEDYDEMDEKYDELKQGIFNASLQVMKELEQEGLFGPKTDGRFLVIWVSDSDDEIINISAKQLNTKKVYQEFASEFMQE